MYRKFDNNNNNSSSNCREMRMTLMRIGFSARRLVALKAMHSIFAVELVSPCSSVAASERQANDSHNYKLVLYQVLKEH